MIGYQEFVGYSQSVDSDERGHAAHLAALAYLNHKGPADEHAALYAALISFLDDPSVKVRAAIAYGLLHAVDAPRPVMLALLHDSAIIAKAVLQYSPVLVDADLLDLVRKGDPATLLAVVQRKKISLRLARELLARKDRAIALKLLRRSDVALDAVLLDVLVAEQGKDAEMRGALLRRPELSAGSRLVLVQAATEALRQCRMVKGALAPERLERLLRDGADTAISTIGEAEIHREQPAYVAELVGADRINARLLLHALVTGHVMFFAACIAELAGVPHRKVYAMLEGAGGASLNALFTRCGLAADVATLLVRLVMHARMADLADDVAARHYVVTALTDELIAEHDGDIPAALEEAFAYLSEQNIALARKAAQGVMAAFARNAATPMALPARAPEMLHLPAA